MIQVHEGTERLLMRKNSKKDFYVHDFLLHDPAGAVTGNYLQAVLHIPSRKLSRMIELERREGWPICASKETDPAAGYWLASTREEAEKYAAGGLNAAAEKMKETADLLLTNLKIGD